MRGMNRKKKAIVNLGEAAEELDVPIAWLKQMAEDGKVPCLKIGKRNARFNIAAVEQALSRLAAQQPRQKPTVLEDPRND